MTKIRRYLFLFILLIFSISCDKLPDEVIDRSTVEYSYKSIEIPEKVLISKSVTIIDIFVEFNEFKNVERLFFTIEDENNNLMTPDYLPLKQNGKIFTEEFVLDENYVPGIYLMNLFVQDKNGELTKSIVHKFVMSIEENVAPFLSGLSAPDTVFVQDPKSVILLKINANDENGPDDIDDVYFIVFRPDSTTSNNRVFMFDDGDFEIHGDDVADDGTYSVLIEVTPSNQKGKYTFDFYVTDKNGLKSTKLKHFIYIL